MDSEVLADERCNKRHSWPWLSALLQMSDPEQPEKGQVPQLFLRGKAVGKLPLQACCEGRESTARGGNSLSAARGSCCQQLPLQGHPSPGCPTECNCSGANCKVLGCTTGCTENCGYRKQCFSGLLKLMTLWRDGSTFSTHKKAHFPLDFPRWIDWLLMNCKKKVIAAIIAFCLFCRQKKQYEDA